MVANHAHRSLRGITVASCGKSPSESVSIVPSPSLVGDAFIFGGSRANGGYLWIFMDIYRYLWIFMDIYGYLWIFMDIYGYLIFMRISPKSDQCIPLWWLQSSGFPTSHPQLQAAAGRGSARCHSARPLQRCWAAATSPRPSDERRHPSPPRACPARTLQVGKPGIPKKNPN